MIYLDCTTQDIDNDECFSHILFLVQKKMKRKPEKLLHLAFVATVIQHDKTKKKEHERAGVDFVSAFEHLIIHHIAANLGPNL